VKAAREEKTEPRWGTEVRERVYTIYIYIYKCRHWATTETWKTT